MVIKYVKWYFAWCSREGTIDNRNIKKYFAKKGDNIIDTVFCDNFTNNCTNDYTKKAILCPTNEACAIINEQISGKIKVKLQNYYSIDSIDSNDIEEITNFPIEFLNSINISGLPPHKLSTKVGAVLMLIRNMNKNLFSKPIFKFNFSISVTAC
jgi:hypothetical protein